MYKMKKKREKSEIVSNDRNPSSKPKRQGNQYKYWCLTWFDFPKECWNSYFNNCVIPLNKYIVGIEICPTTGREHLQGHIECKEPKRMTALKKIHNGIHWEPTKTNSVNVVKYCTKDGQFINKGYTLPIPKYKVTIQNLYPWQEKVIEWLDKEPNDRRIFWVVGKNGKEGKTHFQKYICTNRPGCIVLGGKGHDMKNGVLNFVEKKKKFPKIIFINLCRGDSLDYTGLEALKDMFFFSGKYEGGMVIGPPPHVVVFSNEEPEWEYLSPDRLHVISIDKNMCFTTIWYDGGDFNNNLNCGTNVWVWKKS